MTASGAVHVLAPCGRLLLGGVVLEYAPCDEEEHGHASEDPGDGDSGGETRHDQ